MMLVLGLKVGQSVEIGKRIRVVMLGPGKLGIEAPKEIAIYRSELPASRRLRIKEDR
jgi:carbon storage regulator CsrA